MAYSTQEVVSNGTLVLLDLSINYLERDEVHVSFDDVEDALPWAWVGTSDHKISFSPAVPNGVIVLVTRATSLAAPRHVFSTGAAFTAESLDEDIAQILHIAQEASEGSLGGDYYRDINMHGNQITNLGNAVSPSDAVPLSQYQADASGAYTSKVGAAASAASALSSKNAAATSAASASTSAGTATSAASTATTKASEASVSAAAALASQVAVASTYDSFDDRYLGSKVTEPAVDNDGVPLLSGALFFHAGVGMKVWNATAWELLGGATTGLAPINAPVFTGDVGIGGTPSGQALLVRSTDTFDILDAQTTAGIHVIGAGIAGVGAYGGSITLSQTAGSTRPGAGIASVQSTADPDQCGLAFMVHGGSVTSNTLQQVGVIDATGVATFQSLATEKVNVTAPAASDGNIFTGRYTPTLGNVLNTSARTAYAMSYSRSGDTVTGVGSVSITATAIGRCIVTMSVPVASDFTDANARDAGGAVLSKSTSSPLRDGGHIRSNPSANTLEIDIYAGSTSATEYAVTYQYRVLP